MADDDIPQNTSYEDILERTAAGEALTPEGIRRQLANTADDATPPAQLGRYLDKTHTDTTDLHTPTPSDITSFAQGEYTPGELLDEEAAPDKRFELMEQVGKGGGGRIFAMKDHELKRVIAAKFLIRQNKKQVRAHFVREAQVTAQLQHPNIMPVYDIGMTDHRQVFFTMKKVEGVSLGDAIRRARRGEQVPGEFLTVDGRVRILLKVCDALAFAHSRGFIHQDIKPDNIMLGEYGEVLVLDWGSAVEKQSADSAAARRALGTPAYMSPEQARREMADERSDVYCLGATMFHMLTLRHPTWDDNAETFWEKKRIGSIDPLTAQERHDTPTRLLNISLKAMAAEREKRYQSIEQLADDLKRYQAGLAVTAYRENPVEAFSRWYRRNKRLFWLTTGFIVVVNAVGTLLLREKIKEFLTWTPFAKDAFVYQSTADLSYAWKAAYSHNFITVRDEAFSDSGGWRIEHDVLHGRSISGMHNIAYLHPVPGDIRVEWNATAITQNRDLNCFIAGTNRTEGYTFHVGGFEDPSSVTLTKAGTSEYLTRAILQEPIQTNRTYRLRMEREGYRIRFYIDNRKIIDYFDPDILSGDGHQTFGFENNQGNHIAIDDVRVYYHPLPLKISPVVAADRFVEYGHYAHALIQYREIASLYPGNDIARLAMYKSARCLARMDSLSRAEEVFASFERAFPHHELAPYAGMERVKLIYARADTAAAEETMRVLGARYPGHQVLRMMLNSRAGLAERRMRSWGDRWSLHRDADTMYAELVLRDAMAIQQWARTFGIDPGQIEYLNKATELLYRRFVLHYEDIMRDFPEQRAMQAFALSDLNQFETIVREYGDQKVYCAQALYRMGDYRRVIRKFPEQRRWVSRAMIMLGRYEEQISKYEDRGSDYALALWGSGRTVEALERYAPHLEQEALNSGHYEQYLQSVRTDPIRYAQGLVVSGYFDSALAVLDRFPSVNNVAYYVAYSQALVASGGEQEAVARYAHQPNAELIVGSALSCLGLPESTLAWYPRVQGARSQAFMQLGQYDSVFARCPRDYPRMLESIWITGQEQQFAQRHPQRSSIAAAALLMRNRYRDILEQYPDQREACATALYGLRRYPEIVRRYPDQRPRCIDAMLAMDSASVLLDRFPEARPQYARELLRRGQAQDVLDSFPDQRTAFAQALVLLGRDDELAALPWRFSVEEFENYTAERALHYAAAGRMSTAIAILDSARAFHYRFDYQRFSHFLLSPILRALSGDTAAYFAACRGYMQARPGALYARKLWYETALLAGEISDETFCEQPYKLYCRERLALFSAIRDDIAGRHSEALRQYRIVSETPHCRHPWLRQLSTVNGDIKDLFHSEAVQMFIAWRIRECLSAQSTTKPVK